MLVVTPLRVCEALRRAIRISSGVELDEAGS
jgi:hypothetical protein